MAEGTITSARRHRGALRGRLTQIEKEITKLEGKTMLGPSEQRKIKCLLEQVREGDKEFEQRHLEVLDFIKEEDQEALDAEETISDEHGNHVMEIVERLEQLEAIEESEPLLTAATDPSRSLLIKRLCYLERKERSDHRIRKGSRLITRKSQAIAFAKAPRRHQCIEYAVVWSCGRDLIVN